MYHDILCGIHMKHCFNMLSINTTWCELSSEYGSSCFLNVGRVVFCMWGGLSWGEFSLGRVVLGRVVFGASCPDPR